MKTTITVTDQDIVLGERGIACFCAVTRAAKRADNRIANCDGTHLGAFSPEFGDGYQQFPIPVEVSDWIRKYDRGEPVSPITFEIEIP